MGGEGSLDDAPPGRRHVPSLGAPEARFHLRLINRLDELRGKGARLFRGEFEPGLGGSELDTDAAVPPSSRTVMPISARVF